MPESKEPILRKFDNLDQLKTNGEIAYPDKKVNQAEVDKGFDVNDMQSIMNFEIEYAPVTSTVIIKEVPFYMTSQIGLKLILNDDKMKLYVIMVRGLLANKIFRKGDIVSLITRQSEKADLHPRIFGGVTFFEVEAYNIAGIHAKYADIEQRQKELDEEYRKNK